MVAGMMSVPRTPESGVSKVDVQALGNAGALDHLSESAKLAVERSINEAQLDYQVGYDVLELLCAL